MAALYNYAAPVQGSTFTARTFSSLPARTVSPMLPTAGLPQPTPTTNPIGPITAPIIANPQPISPVSGNPITVSIFQPAQTPAMIAEGAASTPITGLDLISGGQTQTQAATSQPTADQSATQAPGLFGLDTNTWLVLLVVLAAVIAMVLG